jgi:hypothetical protein
LRGVRQGVAAVRKGTGSVKCSEIAFKAAEYMAEHGHCKGRIEDETGAVCIDGAIVAAVTGRSPLLSGELIRDQEAFYCSVTGRADRVCGDRYGMYSSPHWNDLPGVTAEDAILFLKELGALFEAEGN